MSATNTIHVGQIGTIITVLISEPSNGVDVPVDLTGATLVQIQFLDPNTNIIGPFNASILIPKTAGIIEYTDDTGIFSNKGRWQVKGIATFSPTQVFPGSFQGFPVEP